MNEVVRSAAITPERLAVLNQSEWFRGLDPAFQEAVLRSSRVITVAAGESVFDRGDPSDGIYCVISGAVCFGGVAASGKGSNRGAGRAAAMVRRDRVVRWRYPYP